MVTISRVSILSLHCFVQGRWNGDLGKTGYGPDTDGLGGLPLSISELANPSMFTLKIYLGDIVPRCPMF
jgi:hypothetical protein